MRKLPLTHRAKGSFVALLAALGTVLPALGLSACTDDPQDPATWIKKLDDVREQKEAVRQLTRLRDPSAYDALAKLFKKSHDPEHLSAIAKLRTDKAVDLFIEQLDYSDESFDTAAVAATGLSDLAEKDEAGRAAAAKAVDALSRAAVKKLPIKTRANIVKVEAMRALSVIKDGKAVEALDQVLETSPDEQDLFVNKEAARYLGVFADKRSVPSLVRGLFMTSSVRGGDIFLPCRLALARIGEDGVDKLVETMQRKNAQVEEDAKKYKFVSGIVVQKTAVVLGDLRSKRAVPQLVAELSKRDEGMAGSCTPDTCVSGHQSVIQALGYIGDASVVKLLTGMVADAKRPGKLRAAAAEALNLMNATESLPAILLAARTPYYNAKTQTPDQNKAELATLAVTNYSRLLDTDQSALLLPLVKAAPANTDAQVVFKNAVERAQLVRTCDKDPVCYGKALTDPSPARQEKAAFMLGRLGPAGLPILAKNVGHRDSVTRSVVLFSLTRVAGTHNKDVLKALDDQIELDRTKPPLLSLVFNMRITEAIISHR